MTVWGERFDAARDGEEFKQVLNNLFGVLEKANAADAELSLDCGIISDPYCVKCGIPHPDGKCGR